jgi:hypothetical protein
MHKKVCVQQMTVVIRLIRMGIACIYNNRLVECKTRCLCIRIVCAVASMVRDNAVWWARWPLRAAMVTIARAPTGVPGVARDPCVSSRRDDHGRDPRRCCRCRHRPYTESHVCPRPPPRPNVILPPLHFNAIMLLYAECSRDSGK